MAEKNRDWGYCRIQAVLSNLGYEIARNTIADILQRRGIAPAPDRKRKIASVGVASERFVCSIKECCLDRMIFFGEGSLRKVIDELVLHYHGERLGGMLNYYYRAAA
jgi:hypothetical protein